MKRAIQILNSFLWPVLAVFFVEHPDLVLPPTVFPAGLQHGLLGRCVIAAVNSFIIAGASGCLVEILSGEEMATGFRKFRDNVESFWVIYFVLALLPIAFSAAISVLFPTSGPFYDILQSYSEPVILFVLAALIILTKYVEPLGLTRKSIAASPKRIVLFFAVYGLYIAGAHFASYLATLHSPWGAVLGLLNVYLRFVLFVLFAGAILHQYPQLQSRFTGGRELFLINPAFSLPPQSFASLIMRSYPAVFAVLRALTPSRYRIREFNRVLWRERYYQGGALVAITCFTANCAEAYKIAKEFRKRGSTVVMGGPHVMFLQEEALEFCDSIVIGPAEDVWERVIQDYEAGRLQKKYVSSYAADNNGRVYDYLLTRPPEELKDILETSRGCRFKCFFCANPALGGLRSQRTVDEVVALVRKVKGPFREFEFLDVNIYANPAYAKELFRALIPLKVRWLASASIDIAQDDETVELLKASGCRMLLIGYEIFEGSQEAARGGKFEMVGRYLELSKKLKKAGIGIKGQFIFGFPKDNWKTFVRLWAFCFRLFPTLTVVGFLTPFPGSPFFKEALEEDRLINLNWRDYYGHALVFDHKIAKNFLFLKGFFFVTVGFLLTTSLFGAIFWVAVFLVMGLSFSAAW